MVLVDRFFLAIALVALTSAMVRHNSRSDVPGLPAAREQAVGARMMRPARLNFNRNQLPPWSHGCRIAIGREYEQYEAHCTPLN
jgi:hypothetical protein